MKKITPDVARVDRSDDQAEGSSSAAHAEYEARLVYSLLQGAVQLARRAQMSSKRLQELVALAYFQRLRADGATLREIADVFGQTKRSVANLSQRAKENFLSPERENTLPRRIEHHLWNGPQSVEQLSRALPGWERQEIVAGLERLIEQQRARRVEASEDGEGERYEVASKQANLLEDALSARIDALNNLVDALADLVESRFIDEDPRGMARTITLRVPSSALPSIKDELFSLVYKHCELLDQAASPDDDSFYLVYALTPVASGSEGSNGSSES